MQEVNKNKPIKVTLKMAIVISIIIIVVSVLLSYFINKTRINKYYLKNGTILDLKEYAVSDTTYIETYNNEDYYIIKDDYQGEYDIQFVNFSDYYNTNYDLKSKFEKTKIMDFNEYMSYCSQWKIEQKYTDPTKNYAIISYAAYGVPSIGVRLVAVNYENNNANIYMWDDTSGVTADILAYVIVIPTEKNVNNINVVSVYTGEEFDNIKKYGTTYNPNGSLTMFDAKPIIYLYPTEETKVSVKLLKDDSITCSYPKYEESWEVVAKPNGDLTYLSNGRQLYALYYESKNNIKIDVQKDGFIVKSEDVAEFLEEKLEILGLNQREAEEFIIYWLPKLESNKYNYIRFATEEEINENMPLEINPKPDTIIRILMTYKGLDEPIDVEEQKLITPERNGFVVVEWGGTEIK